MLLSGVSRPSAFRSFTALHDASMTPSESKLTPRVRSSTGYLPSILVCVVLIPANVMLLLSSIAV